MPILSYLLPLSLEYELIVKHANIHPFGTDGHRSSVNTIAVHKGKDPAVSEKIAWALHLGLVTDIDVQSELNDDAGWEAVEELLDSVISHSEVQNSTVVLCM